MSSYFTHAECVCLGTLNPTVVAFINSVLDFAA